MDSLWIWILLMIANCQYVRALGGDICRTTEKCNCINVISSGNLEFQCPPSGSEKNKTIIHIYGPSKRMRIDCEYIDIFNVDLLPDVKFNFVRKLELHECPLPAKGFSAIIKKFSMNNLEFLRFAEHSVYIPLSGEDFQGLKNMKTLEMKRNNMLLLDGKIFEKTPNLSDLILDGNKLILNESLFKYTTNLTVLSINSNEINRIPDKVFVNLNKLEKLFLWQNNLNVLRKGVFEGLINLKMLELSLNNIEIIENDVFKDTKNLTKVSLRRNKIKNISRKTFQHCRNIELINIDENPHIVIEEDSFSNFKNLKIINLAYNEIENITEGLFRESTNLEKITLNNNGLRKLPDNIFDELSNLKELHLQFNKIKSITPETFKPLEKLEYLYLQNNQLEEIHHEILQTMNNLKGINLSFNKIIHLPTQLLSRNKNLMTFKMSHNHFDFEEPTLLSYNTPFSSFSSTNLKDVDLSYNNITRYPYDLNGIATIENIKLNHNSIREITVDLLSTMNAKPVSIDLRFNNISTINFIDSIEHQKEGFYERFRVDVEISNNPILCDCNAFYLAKYLREYDHPIRNYLVLNYNEMKCAGPQKLLAHSLEDVPLHELTCKLNNNCTSSEFCDCIFRPSDETLVIDCSKKNLSEVPRIEDVTHINDNFKGIEVHLEDNSLERCPYEYDGYQNTSSWYMKGNAIKNITWIPDSLKLLDLTKNQIETIDGKSIQLLNQSKLNNLFIGSNPWKCDCDVKDFLKYSKDHIIQIDVSDIRCNATGIRLVELSENDICSTGTEMILIITVMILLLLFFITSVMSYYLLHKNEILIWLYGRGYCLWLIKEEELDESKIYDAFISFSHKDEDFVIENLVSVLETGNDPYKLCIHFRDWIPGEMIQSQIISSVNDSRRTIVVLSANFLESVWGIVEFKTAHNEAMREGRARVILIICGDINIENLDEDLKAYLKTNTYIKWGDPWFWDKLKFALPKRSNRQKWSTKHANMMQYIDDKFKLMEKQTTQNVSTPIVLSPKTLDHDPLTCIA